MLAPTHPSPRPVSVLVIDDYPDGASSLAEVLSLCGFSARAATDPDAALAAARAYCPDVVVLEPWLRTADGFALAERMSGLPGGRPRLVALTGYLPDGDTAWRAVFDKALLKPADPTQLLSLLRSE